MDRVPQERLLLRSAAALLIAACLVPVFFLPRVFAQDEIQECVGLDVVFLIDQSGSMELNDRFQLRKAAIATAVDILGDNAVYFCPGTKHRIAVIGFGGASDERDAVRTYVPSTVISGTIGTLSVWKEQREDEIKASVPVSDQLGATDHFAALESAAQVLQDWRMDPIEGPDRKRGVVMVTDGGPCPVVIDNQCAWSETRFGSQQAYLDEIARLTDPVRADFPWRGEFNPESIFMAMIAFNDESNPNYDYLSDGQVARTWRSMAEGHGGALYTLSRGSEVSSANAELTGIVANILDRGLGSNLRPWDCREPIWVDPYRSNATIIHVFRRGADPGVSLDDVIVEISALQGGEVVAVYRRGAAVEGEGKVTDYTQDGPNERYVFRFPLPGQYLVSTQGADVCRDLDVRIGEVGIAPNMLEPAPDAVYPEVADAPYYDTVNPPQFRVQLLQQGTDESQEPLVEQRGFPLAITATVRSLGDVVQPFEQQYELKLTDPENAIYTAEDPVTKGPAYIQTRFPGTYEWQLTATTIDPRSLSASSTVTMPLTVLETGGLYRVTPVEGFGFVTLDPTQGDVVLANEIGANGEKISVPLKVEIQLVDSQGNALSPRQVLKQEGEPTFELRVYDPNGRLLETAELEPDLLRSVLSAQLRQGSPVQAPDPPGEYRLAVRLLGNYQTDKYRPIMELEEIVFNRAEVQSVDFSIVSPRENERLPLVDGVAPSLLRVETQLQDSDGEPLDPTPLALRDGSAPFVAKLLDPSGVLLDSKQMRIEPGSKVLSAELESGGANPAAYQPRCYRLQVELDNLQSDVFRPIKNAVSSSFCFQVVEEFSWAIAEPEDEIYPIYPMMRWFPDPTDVPLIVRTLAADGRALPASELLRSTAANLFRGRLRVPSGEVYADLEFIPSEKPGEFAAKWPVEANARGEYSLDVGIVNDNLSAAWLPAVESIQTRVFERSHKFLNMPWSLLAMIILVALIALSSLMIYVSAGPLAGVKLVFIGKSSDGRSESSLGFVNLSGRINRRRITAKGKRLNDAPAGLNLQRVDASAVKPEEDSNARVAADITLISAGSDDGDGDETPITALPEGVKFPIQKEIKVVLEKEPTSKVPLWLLAVIAASLVSWAVVFGYLYVNA